MDSCISIGKHQAEWYNIIAEKYQILNRILTEEEAMTVTGSREINRYPDSAFPAAIYRVSHQGMTPPGRGVGDFHWHKELQFTCVEKGSATIRIDTQEYVLQTGDAAFINSDIIHAVTALSAGGSYASLDVPVQMLSFFPGSRMESDAVMPYISGAAAPALIFRADEERHKEVLAALREINACWDDRSARHWEYQISVRITALWYAMICSIADGKTPYAPADPVRQQRLRAMLSFIYEHYPEDIMLTDIASAASISVGECCRIFRSHLHTTPHKFLTAYRIRQSVQLLSGEYSVAQIAGMCGYNQTSNYIAVFKSIMHCTPAQYRRRPGSGPAGRNAAPDRSG